jgi:hypothetical protein
LRSPPIRSGSDVVGAATIAPVGTYVRMRSASALRRTGSRQSPSTPACASQRAQSSAVSWSRSSTQSRRANGIGSSCVERRTSVAVDPFCVSKRPVISSSP